MKGLNVKYAGIYTTREVGEPRKDTEPGTPFENLHLTGEYCPHCGAGLNRFRQI